MKGDSYFTFPLTVLNGQKKNTTALGCLELAINCGAYNAGYGFYQKHDADDFYGELEDACDYYDFSLPAVKKSGLAVQFYIVGARVCGISYEGKLDGYIARANAARSFIEKDTPPKTPYIRMSSNSLWSATYQARYEDGEIERPERGISWQEFRILAAILSWPTENEGFTAISSASIGFRACGFVNRKQMVAATTIPEHLPKLSRKQIETTLVTLEALNFFARFRLSSGPRGGKYYYSFRHSREELALAVCDKINFKDRLKIAQNREEDARKCSELLKRHKS